ncbi:hypothetical protein Mgra_00001892 [Meloidogyne graminicola]|uniref:Rho-GAP domain-containing protein n=1 Tax=Meloidogyne graminicola TaxID=189291 RepID=A0A8S9ZZ22_9BILA|nr:hypothetical protein Mgra_00001892 [Meloidogyne graminicola]
MTELTPKICTINICNNNKKYLFLAIFLAFIKYFYSQQNQKEILRKFPLFSFISANLARRLIIFYNYNNLINSLLLSDVERFTAHVGRLRKALITYQNDLEKIEIKNEKIKLNNNNNNYYFVQIHSSLALVSQSIKDLICKHSNLFKTNNILTTTGQLVHSIKEANFNLNENNLNKNSPLIYTLPALQALDKLENAVANSLRGALGSECSSTLLPLNEDGNISIYFQKINENNEEEKEIEEEEEKKENNYFVKNNNNKLLNEENKINNLNFGAETEQDEEEEEEDDNNNNNNEEIENGSVKSVKANSSSGVSSSPIGLLPIKKTAKIIRRHSAFQLSSQKIILPPHPPNNKKINNIGIVHSLQQPLSVGENDGQLNNNEQRPMLAKNKQYYLQQQQQIGKQQQFSNNSSSQSVEILSNNNNNNQCNNSMWQLLEQCNDGMEIAFERCKNWSKYASQLLSFGRARLSLEHEYGQRLFKISEQQLIPLTIQQQQQQQQQQTENNNNSFQFLEKQLPLSKLFNQLLENNKQFSIRADSTVEHLQQRFIESLESRQKEHNLKRKKLKINYAKQKKQMEACAEELRRARQTHTNKGEQYLRAREVTIKQELNNEQQQQLQQQFSFRNSEINNQQIFHQKRRKEFEKRKKAEEEALNKKADAEQEVCRLEKELDGYRNKLTELRRQTIHELSDLIRQCELTTIACTATFFKGIANLWAPVPNELESLADVARTTQPGQEFIKMIVSSNSSNPFCSSDSGSSPQQRPNTLLTSQKCLGGGGSTTPSLASCSSSIPSPNRAIQRRNALAATEEHLLINESQQKRRTVSKTSMAKLFDIQSSSSSSPSAAIISSSSSKQYSSSIIYSDAARSHKLQRTRQVAKCAQCEHLLLFDALKCQCCLLVWHRKCLPNVQIRCGPNMKRFNEQNNGKDYFNNLRRTSIFGVPLNIHLNEQRRQIPLILEKCIDELQKRGMCCKGLYRTCGVKSKVEEICVQFEQSTINSPVDLNNVHPMNIASVVKLYLRRLPEPLLTYELYSELLNIGIFSSNQEEEENKQGEEQEINVNNNSSLQFINLLKQLIQKLPIPNLQTLKYLILHLNRITWFELQNLMTASNLAAVIAPSLLWQRLPLPNAIISKGGGGGGISSNNNNYYSSSCIKSINNNNNQQQQQFISDAHRQSKTIELLIKYAFEIFDEDKCLDWRKFFIEYPGVSQPQQQQQRRHSLAATACNSSLQNNNNNNEITNNNNIYHSTLESTISTNNIDDDIVDDEEDEEEEEEVYDNELDYNNDNNNNIELLINNNENKKLNKIIFNRRQSLGEGGTITTTKTLIENNTKNNNEKQKLSRLKTLGTVMGKIDNNQQQQQQQFIYSINNNNNNKYLFQSPSTAPSQRRLNFQSHKQRSFTTSILVSPLSFRKNNYENNNNINKEFEIKNNSSSSSFSNNKQRKLFSHKSLDENIVQKQHNELGRRSTIKSGEVTVQLGKDCLPNDGGNTNRLCVKLLSSFDTDVINEEIEEPKRCERARLVLFHFQGELFDLILLICLLNCSLTSGIRKE